MHGSGLCAWASGRTGMALVTEFLCKIGARLWQQGSYQAYMVIGWTTMVRFMKLFRKDVSFGPRNIACMLALANIKLHVGFHHEHDLLSWLQIFCFLLLRRSAGRGCLSCTTCLMA